MRWAIVNRATLELDAIEVNEPPQDYYPGWRWFVVPVPDSLNLALRDSRPIITRDEFDQPVGFATEERPPTKFTIEQIDSYNLEAARRHDRVQRALTNAAASVNGKSVTDLTAGDLTKIVILLCAENGWVDDLGRMNIK